MDWYEPGAKGRAVLGGAGGNALFEFLTPRKPKRTYGRGSRPYQMYRQVLRVELREPEDEGPVHSV